MLKSLAVSNFAVIQRLAVEFQPGLNVITGETGAGKSILVDALALLLGERGSADLLRAGEDRLRVEAVFEIPAGSPAAERIEEPFPGQAEGGEILLRRELGRDGRSRAWVGTAPATLASLRQIGAYLAEIQGQHDSQGLRAASAQRDWLDAFAGLAAERQALLEKYRRMRELEERVSGAAAAERERLQRIDLLRFQIEEVAQIDPRPGEDEALRAERDRIRHAERLRAAAQEALGALYENEESAATLLGRARARLSEMAGLDPASPPAAALGEAGAAIADTARALSEYLERLESEPGRLERLEERRLAIEALKRKYGGSVEELLAGSEQRRRELEALERAGLDREENERALAEGRRDYWEAAEMLSALRRRAAADLEGKVGRELKDLAMPRARLEVRFAQTAPPWPEEQRPQASAAGEPLEFLLAANPGEDPRPLGGVASGGELSRLFLALNVVLPRGTGAPLALVVDEVDAGVGADVAIAIGQRLRRVAARHQVLCVTHLHPIAAAADHHFRVDKRAGAGRTEVRIRKLEGGERIEEILRMMGGAAAGAAGRAAAAEWVRRREVTPT